MTTCTVRIQVDWLIRAFIEYDLKWILKRMAVTYRFTLDDVYGIGVVDMGIVNASR